MWIKGYTYGYQAKRGIYRTEDAARSQERLFELGINWMCLAFPVMQKSFSSTEIYFDYRHNVTDKDLITTIEKAHKKGVKVCLKPMINSADGVWRAQIDFPDADMMGNDRYWKQWFEFYGAFLRHYAEIAQDTGCEMLCIGCEMSGTERKEALWRELIAEIRTIYSGPLVYNTNHGREELVQWFDALDYIGTSAYYPVGRAGGTRESMLREWQRIGTTMNDLSKKLKKQIIFMEIGCRSAKGCASMPWDFAHTELKRDEEEQANFYDTCLTAFHDQDWFAGVFWWDWSTVIYKTKEEAQRDKGFNIHLKKAEAILKEWYSRV